MKHPPPERRTPPGAATGRGFDKNSFNSTPAYSAQEDLDQALDHEWPILTSAEVYALRCIWWTEPGTKPAEPGVILIRGGRP